MKFDTELFSPSASAVRRAEDAAVFLVPSVVSWVIARIAFMFAATGVTSGAMLAGVKFGQDVIETETVVMRSATGTVRWVRSDHRQFSKFHLG